MGQCPFEVTPDSEFPFDENMVECIAKIRQGAKRARGVPAPQGAAVSDGNGDGLTTWIPRAVVDSREQGLAEGGHKAKAARILLAVIEKIIQDTPDGKAYRCGGNKKGIRWAIHLMNKCLPHQKAGEDGYLVPVGVEGLHPGLSRINDDDAEKRYKNFSSTRKASRAYSPISSSSWD